MRKKKKKKIIAGEMKEAENRIPFFVAVNVVSVWRPGFPVLRLFVVYIARAPSNYCADATPTRGVWSQIHSLCHNLSRLYRRADRSPCNVYTFMTHTWGHVSRLSLCPPSLFLSQFAQCSHTQPAVRTDVWPLPRTSGALPAPGTVMSGQ